jgi:hypothetical protein
MNFARRYRYLRRPAVAVAGITGGAWVASCSFKTARFPSAPSVDHAPAVSPTASVTFLFQSYEDLDAAAKFIIDLVSSFLLYQLSLW